MPKKVTKSNKAQLSHRQRLAALLISVGLKQSEAARIVGVRREQITRWKKDEAFREYLDKKMAEVEKRVEGARDILVEAAPLAALKLMGLLDSEDEAVLLRASGQILDRVGIAKTTEIQAEVTTPTIWDKLLEALREDKEDGDERED